MNKFVLCVILLMCYISSVAQVQRCHATEKMQERASKDPLYAKKLHAFLNKKMSPDHTARQSGTIPVHVILIHPPGQAIGTGNNFSLAHVESQIQVLNDDFARANADAGNTPSQFSAVDTGIKFCLASVDPNGNATDGITRFSTNQDFEINEGSIKSQTTWDHTSYMNIWSAELSNDLLGYAYFPGTASSTLDGVVITAGAFGGEGWATMPLYNLGRTATHEVGHYLGIDHVWGMGNGGCGIDDGFADTPTQEDSNTGCPTHPSPSCGNSGDMFMNYMDYVNDNCMNAFTADQSIKMNFELSTSRSGLLSASLTKCAPSTPMTAQVQSVGDPLCNGESTGFIEIEASGGQSPYTYTLDNGTPQNVGFFSGLNAGTYEIEVLDSNGQNLSITVTLENPAPLSILTINMQDVLCHGDSNGLIEVSGEGGTSSGQYAYALNNSPVSTLGLFNNLPAGEYNITVADANNCTSTQVFEIVNPNDLVFEESEVINNLCADGTEGIISLNATGGTGNLNYAIFGESNSSTSTFAGLGNGSVDFIVTDANNCTETITETITSPPSLALAIDNIAGIICPNDMTAVTLAGNGGMGVLSYSINGMDYQVSPTFTDLTPGNYEFSVKDENACITTINTTITQPDPTTISVDSQTAVECFGDYSGDIQISAIGNGAISFQLNGESNTTGYFSNLTAQNYTVITTDGNQCTTTHNVAINQTSTLEVVVVVKENVSCNNANDGSLSLGAMGGAGSYKYSVNDSPFSTQTEYASLVADTYKVIVEDIGGCQSLRQIEITQADEITLTQMDAEDITCTGEVNGMILLNAIGGNGILSYTINGTTNTTGVFNNLPVGLYEVTISDINNCSMVSSFMISEPMEITVDTIEVINSNCDGDPIGAINVTADGGTGNLSYTVNNITNTTGQFDNLTDGSYTILIEDQNGCTQDTTTTVLATTDILTTIQSIVQPTCSDALDGMIVLESNGGNGILTYGLNGQSNNTGIFDNLEDGNYIAVITDADGCFGTYAFDIVAPDPIIITGGIATGPACNNGSDGTYQATASGGTGSLSYTINGLTNTTGSFNNLTSGNYELIIVDTNNCTSSMVVDIPVTLPIITNIDNLEDNLCFGDNTGSVQLSTTSGTDPIQYTLGGESNTLGQFNNLSFGEYDVLVTDANGCTTDVNFNIEQGLEIITQVTSVINNVCAGDMDGSFIVSASGNGDDYIYQVNEQSNNNGIFNNLIADEYELVVTSETGCTSTTTVIISEAPAILISDVNLANISCHDDNDGSINVVAQNGVGTLSYSVDGATNTTGVFENLAAGDYNISIVDDNGCMNNSYTAVINNPDIIGLSVVPCTDIDNCTLDSYIVVATGGTSPYFYSNNGGMIYQLQGEFLNMPDGSYNIEVKDFNGCIETLMYDFSTVMIDDNNPSLQHERLYPVPTKELLTLEFVINTDQQIEFTTLDMEGKLIETVSGDYTRGFNMFTIDVSDYPSAIYLLGVKNNTERRYYKFNKTD